MLTRQNLNKFLNKTLLVSSTSLLLCLLFYGYLVYVGIPKTQARNYYNLAQNELEKNNIDNAKQDLEKAISYWNEPYINQALLDMLAKNK